MAHWGLLRQKPSGCGSGRGPLLQLKTVNNEEVLQVRTSSALYEFQTANLMNKNPTDRNLKNLSSKN